MEGVRWQHVKGAERGDAPIPLPHHSGKSVEKFRVAVSKGWTPLFEVVDELAVVGLLITETHPPSHAKPRPAISAKDPKQSELPEVADVSGIAILAWSDLLII